MNPEETLTLKHYKLPLLPIPTGLGFGYYGALSVTTDGDKVQCHLCGKLYESLALHIYGHHNMRVAEYREKFNLSRSTALVSEKERERLKEATLTWLKSLSKEQKRKMQEKATRAVRAWKKENPNRAWRIRLETKNKRGTCPDQLLAKITEIKEKLGYVPSLKEFVKECGTERYKHLIFTTFGSWANALSMLKYEQKENTSQMPKYTDEELLEYLVNFAKTNGRVPTCSDSKRDFLPSKDTYRVRFGSFERAKELAGLSSINL